MSEERAPLDYSTDPDPNPQYPRGDESSTLGLKVAVAIFMIIAGIAVAYGWFQHDAAQQVTSEQADLTASLASAKSQEDALTQRVGTLQAQLLQDEAGRNQGAASRTDADKNEQFPSHSAEASTPRHVAHRAAIRRVATQDPRWKQFQQQLGEQQKALAENQQQLASNQQQIAETQANLQAAKTDLESGLQSTRTDLGGNIARNHDQLVALEKKGERNYFEFSFEKSKAYHHTGPISIALRKADSKHEYCDLQMLVDDREITRKHVNLYESVSFYPEGYPLPIELVINRIDKDSVKGYVSEPKYRSTESASVAAPPAPAPAESVNPPAQVATPDAKLEHRTDVVH